MRILRTAWLLSGLGSSNGCYRLVARVFLSLISERQFKTVLPELRLLLRKSGDRKISAILSVLIAHRRLSAEAVPEVSELLSIYMSSKVRLKAIRALSSMGPAALPAVEDLKSLYWDTNPRVRRAAQDAARRIALQGANKWSCGEIIDGLEARDLRVVSRAFLKLEKLNRRGIVTALPTLIRLLKSDEWPIVHQAVLTLARLGPAAAPAASALADALEHPNSFVRAFAATSLSQVGRAAASAVPSLIRVLQDEDDVVASSAVDALRVLGDEASAAVPDLERLLSTMESALVRHQVRDAIAQIRRG